MPRPASAIPRRAKWWSTSPTGRSCGCSSTTSRSTSASATCSAMSECSTFARVSYDALRIGARRPANGRVSPRSARLVRATRGGGRLLRSRAARGAGPPGRAVGARGERAHAGAERRSACGCGACRTAQRRTVRRSRLPGRARPHDEAQRPPHRRSDGQPRRGARWDRGRRARDDRRPGSSDDHGQPRAWSAASAGEVPRLWLVEPQIVSRAA